VRNINFTIKSERSEILKFEKILEDINKEFGLIQDRLINYQIAISEALVNAIVHGNKENPEKSVFIEINFDKEKLETKIKDQGNGFILEDIPDPTENNNLLKEHGRGIFIIKSLVDKFECHSSKNGTEFILTIVK
jgi:serine/threonine-protein kinase RsbW